MVKNALITGSNGQDGSILTELLLNKGYNVIGLNKTNQNIENLENVLGHPNYKSIQGSITDSSLISFLIQEYQFDEIYNFASQSNVRYSYDNIFETFESTLMGYINLVENVNKYSKGSKVFQSVSSAIFGRTLEEKFIVTEEDEFRPVSPYASAKLFTYNFGMNFRELNKLKIINGILFNHESPKRKRQTGILSTIVQKTNQIRSGQMSSWHVPNLELEIDMSDADETVRVIYELMQAEEFSDFNIASAHNYSIRQLCEMVFLKFDLNYLDYVTFDQHPRKNFAKADCSRLNKIGIFMNSSIDVLIDKLIFNELNKI